MPSSFCGILLVATKLIRWSAYSNRLTCPILNLLPATSSPLVPWYTLFPVQLKIELVYGFTTLYLTSFAMALICLINSRTRQPDWWVTLFTLLALEDTVHSNSKLSLSISQSTFRALHHWSSYQPSTNDVLLKTLVSTSTFTHWAKT